MKYLILAAGQGSRLKPAARVKPLARLLGLTLLERAVNLARGAGFSDIYVVLGYRADEIEDFIRRKNIPVKAIRNHAWEKGNGTSVQAARTAVNGDSFIIAMADHIADPSLVTQVAGHTLDDCDVILAVDPSPSPVVDLEDATRVKLNGDRITDIGKELAEWDAIDTGFFKAKPGFFRYFDHPEFDGSLTGAVRLAARDGRARVVTVKGDWLDVDSPEAPRQAENLLLKNLTKPTDGPVSRVLNRPLSTRLSRLLVNTNITPDQISVFSFLLSLGAAALMALPGYAYLVLGGVLAQLSSIIDGCDGEVARLKAMTSEFGAWFDAVLDRYADFLLVTGLSVHALYETTALTGLIVGLFALSGSLINSYTADKFDAFLRRKGGMHLRLGRDVRIFLIFAGSLLGLSLPTLVVLALINHGEVIRRIFLLKRHAG